MSIETDSLIRQYKIARHDSEREAIKLKMQALIIDEQKETNKLLTILIEK